MSGCKTLLSEGYYITRHNKICKYFHWKVYRDIKIDVNDNIWEHEQKPTVASRNVSIFYDKIKPVGKYIEGNAVKLDIVIWNRQNKTAKIIEVTVPNDYGLNRAETTKVTKYQELKSDLRTAWSLKEIDII